MAEWIGHLMSNFPIWLSLPIIIIIAIVGLLFWGSINAGVPIWPFNSKQEWWQDRQRRLEKEAQSKIAKAKLKARKG